MALALSKQTKREIEALGAALGDLASAVANWRSFAATNEKAIAVWPKQPAGMLEGYNVTLAQLTTINALAIDLAALTMKHAAALALLKELTKNGNR